MQRSKIERRRPRRLPDDDGEVRGAAVGAAHGGGRKEDFRGQSARTPVDRGGLGLVQLGEPVPGGLQPLEGC